MEFDFHSTNVDSGEGRSLYECVVEEISLEGLDGITFQGLVERLVDREGKPISRDESVRVMASIWESVKRDTRLRFYFLPEARPNLRLYNRCLRSDQRGVFEEPLDAPEDIYTYSCVEDFQEPTNKKDKLKSIPLSHEDVNRMDLRKRNYRKSNVILGGIRFGKIEMTSIKKNKVQSQPNNKQNLMPDSSKKISNVIAKSSRMNSTKEKCLAKDKKLTSPEPKSQIKRKTITQSKSKSSSKNSSSNNEQTLKNKSNPEGNNDGQSDWVDKSFEKLPSIRGSCASYYFRKDISRNIRNLGITYLQAIQMFGNRLVIVANQFMRESVLFCGHTRARITGPQYCVVERIGRARHYGEQGRGKVSLTCMKIDAKTQFYYRKSLLSDGFITKQGLIMKFPGCRTGTLISLFHLPHFFKRLDTAEAINIRKMFAHICNNPEKTVDYYSLQHIFGKYLIKTLKDEYTEFVNIEEEIYATLHPDEFKQETKEAKRETMLKRRIKVIRLKNPNMGIKEVIEKQLTVRDDEDDEDGIVFDNDDTYNDGDKEEGAEFNWTFCYDSAKELANEFEATTIVRFVISRGNKGVVQEDLINHMQVTNLDSRSAARYLTRWKIAKGITEDRGKVKIIRYIYSKCEGPSQAIVSSDEEEETNLFGSLPLEVNLDYSQPSQNEIIKLTDSKISDTFKKSNLVNKSKSNLPTLSIPPGADAIVNLETKPQKITSKKKGFKKSEVETPFTTKAKSKISTKIVKIPKDPKPRSLSSDNTENKPNVSETKRKKQPLQKLSWEQLQNKLSSSVNVKENKKPKKARSYSDIYDDVDRKALALLKRQRVDWTAEEDRTILYLFIASITFIPRYNMQRVFIFNSAQIRDILHRVVELSNTKTSIAVRRRIHNLMKNRVFYAQYRNYLNAALIDEELYTKYIEPFTPTPSVTIFHPIPSNALYGVFEYLKNKFEKTDFDHEKVDGSVCIEDILNERELRKMETIWTDVWGNLFKKFRPRKRYQLPESMDLSSSKSQFHRKISETEDESQNISTEISGEQYENIEGSESTNDVSKMNSNTQSFLSLNKKEGKKEKQYSDEEITYVLHISKNIIDSIDASDCSSSDSDEDGPSQIVEETEPPSKKRRLNPNQPSLKNDMKELRRIQLKDKKLSDTRKIDIVSCERDATSDNDVKIWTVRTAVMSMMFSGELYDSIETFMSSISNSSLERALGSLRNEGIICVTKPTKRFSLALQMKRLLSIYLVPKAFTAAKNLLSSLLKKDITFIRSHYDLGTVFLLSEIAPMVKIEIKIPQNIINVHEQWKKDYSELLKSHENLANDMENFALRLLRLKLNSHAMSAPIKLVEKDFFDINLPHVFINRCQTEKLCRVIQGNVCPDAAGTKFYLENSLIKIVEFNEVTQTFGATKEERVLGDHGWLYDVICICGETGISMKFLESKFPKKKLKDALLYLIDCNYIYLVGIKNRKFVAATFMKNWTSTILGKSTLGPDTSKRVVMRPWMNSTGNVNWNFVDRSYTAILGFMNRNPIILVEEICRLLSPILSAVEIMILLSTLHHFKMIDFYQMVRKKRVGPFTKSSFNKSSDIEGPFKSFSVDAFLEMENLYLELLPFHTLKYSQIQNIFPFPSPTTTTERSKSTDTPTFDYEEEIILGPDTNVPDILM